VHHGDARFSLRPTTLLTGGCYGLRPPKLVYTGLDLDEKYIEGWVEGCLKRIGENYPDEEQLFRDLWEDETQRDVVIESLKADCEVRVGRPLG
jgi:hypothetical protein